MAADKDKVPGHEFVSEDAFVAIADTFIKARGFVFLLRLLAKWAEDKATDFAQSTDRDERSASTKWFKVSRMLEELAVKVKFL